MQKQFILSNGVLQEVRNSEISSSKDPQVQRIMDTVLSVKNKQFQNFQALAKLECVQIC
jgi:hypothetical protein